VSSFGIEEHLVPLDVWAQVGAQRLVADEVDRTPQGLGKLALEAEPAKAERRPVGRGLELDENVQSRTLLLDTGGVRA